MEEISYKDFDFSKKWFVFGCLELIPHEDWLKAYHFFYALFYNDFKKIRKILHTQRDEK